MSIFSYIVKSDSGFAPNPYHGVCTLACCKPEIRRTAQIDDWVVGLTPKAMGHRLVYAMRVTRAMSFKDYWFAYPSKRPSFETVVGSLGDNIYEPRKDGGYKQHRSGHSLHCNGKPTSRENKATKQADLSTDRVLIGRVFIYWGAKAPELPGRLREALAVARGHRRHQPEAVVRWWTEYIDGQPKGRHGEPRSFTKEGCPPIC